MFFYGTQCSTDRWAVWAKIRQSGHLSGRCSETGSRNMAVTQKNQVFDPGFLFTPSESLLLERTVSPQYKTLQTTDDRQTTDRRDTVPKARPIVPVSYTHLTLPTNREV